MLLFAGCTDSSHPPESAATICQSEVTPIPELQGDGYTSPLTGSESTVRGIVTYVVNGDGFYIEELGSSRDTLTSLTDLSGHEICAENLEPPLTQAKLPLNSAEREALEGMRLSFDQQLTVTDVYNLFRGELTLSSSGVLWVPTEIRMPGPTR